MQRKDLAALVTGTSVGMAGAALSVILARTIGGAALDRFLDQLGIGEQYVELESPVAPTAQQDTRAVSSLGAPMTRPGSGLPKPANVPRADRAAISGWQAAEIPINTSATQG